MRKKVSRYGLLTFSDIQSALAFYYCNCYNLTVQDEGRDDLRISGFAGMIRVMSGAAADRKRTQGEWI